MSGHWPPGMWAPRMWPPRMWLAGVAGAVFAAVAGAVRRVRQAVGGRDSYSGGRRAAASDPRREKQ